MEIFRGIGSFAGEIWLALLFVFAAGLGTGWFLRGHDAAAEQTDETEEGA